MEDLGDDAHAHPVALTEAEVDLDLLSHISPQYLHRDMVVSRHVLHVDPLQTIEVDLVARHEVQQVLERDRALHPGKRCSEATVDAVTEPEVLRLTAIAVD